MNVLGRTPDIPIRIREAETETFQKVLQATSAKARFTGTRNRETDKNTLNKKNILKSNTRMNPTQRATNTNVFVNPMTTADIRFLCLFQST